MGTEAKLLKSSHSSAGWQGPSASDDPDWFGCPASGPCYPSETPTRCREIVPPGHRKGSSVQLRRGEGRSEYRVEGKFCQPGTNHLPIVDRELCIMRRINVFVVLVVLFGLTGESTAKFRRSVRLGGARRRVVRAVPVPQTRTPSKGRSHDVSPRCVPRPTCCRPHPTYCVVRSRRDTPDWINAVNPAPLPAADARAPEPAHAVWYLKIIDGRIPWRVLPDDGPRK
jgi:hypothetical protein